MDSFMKGDSRPPLQPQFSFADQSWAFPFPFAADSNNHVQMSSMFQQAYQQEPSPIASTSRSQSGEPPPSSSTSIHSDHHHEHRRRPAAATTTSHDSSPGDIDAQAENGDHDHENDHELGQNGSTTNRNDINSDSAAATAAANKIKKRRKRAVLSCVPCKKRKIKCDRGQPCATCIQRGIPDKCTWVPDWTSVSASAKHNGRVPASFTSLDRLEGSTLPPAAKTATSASANGVNNGNGASLESQSMAELKARLEYVESLIAKLPAGALEQMQEQTTRQDSPSEDESDHSELNARAALEALETLALGPDHMWSKARGFAPDESKDQAVRHEVPKCTALGMRTIYGLNITGPCPASRRNRKSSTIFLPSPISLMVPAVTAFLADHSPSTLIRSIMKALPRRQVTDTLLNTYDQCFRWMDMTSSKIVFQREYNEFWHHLDTGGALDVIDPAWMAVLFIRLAIASQQMPPSCLDTEDPAVVAVLPDQFFLASKKCLDLADWAVRPQFRTLQCLTMMTLYSCVITNRNEAMITLASAIRIAQILGLDIMGPEQTDMPAWEDLAFPSGPSALKRQLCLRVWRGLNYIDAISAFPKGKVLPELSKTSMPLNVNDEDLETTELILTERPYLEPTDMTFYIMKTELVELWKQMENCVKRTYDDVLLIDKQLRAIIGRLVHVDAAMANGNTSLSHPGRYMIESILSSQMLRLHAPYCGYSDTKHSYSNEACLSAADSVLDSGQHLVRMKVADRFWFLQLHVFSAVMYLLLDLLHSIYFDGPGMSRIIEDRMRQARLAQDIFAHVKQRSLSPLCTRMSDIGESVVSAALTAARERQSLRLSGLRAKEGYAETFKRIMATISATHGTPASYLDSTRYTSVAANPHVGGTSSTVPPETATSTTSVSPQQLIRSGAPAPIVDTSAEDVLRKLGIHLDNLTSGATASQSRLPSAMATSNGGVVNFTNDGQSQYQSISSMEEFNAFAGAAPWPYSAVYEDFVSQPATAFPQDFFSYGLST